MAWILHASSRVLGIAGLLGPVLDVLDIACGTIDEYFTQSWLNLAGVVSRAKTCHVERIGALERGSKSVIRKDSKLENPSFYVVYKYSPSGYRKEE
jgi:hypothetical protein